MEYEYRISWERAPVAAGVRLEKDYGGGVWSSWMEYDEESPLWYHTEKITRDPWADYHSLLLCANESPGTRIFRNVTLERRPLSAPEEGWIPIGLEDRPGNPW